MGVVSVIFCNANFPIQDCPRHTTLQQGIGLKASTDLSSNGLLAFSVSITQRPSALVATLPKGKIIRLSLPSCCKEQNCTSVLLQNGDNKAEGCEFMGTMMEYCNAPIRDLKNGNCPMIERHLS